MIMPTRVAIITNPAYDEVTNYLYAWSEELINSATSNPGSFSIHELNKDEVNRENLIQLVEEKNPHLILFHGHGGSAEIYGFEHNVLIACDDNEELLKSRIIYSLTCDSGKKLGPKCVSLGTKAFVGYKKEFKFAHLGMGTKALQRSDILAKMFLQPAFEISKAFLEGSTLEQAYRKSQIMYANNLQILLTSSNPTISQTYASGLYHDMINQVALGNPSCSC